MKNFALLAFSLFIMNQNMWIVSVDSASEASDCGAHVHFQLKSLAGEWESYVHYASEDGTTVMPNNNCEKVTWFESDTETKVVQSERAITVATDNAVLLGHINGKYKDFFQVLTVTMTQKPSNKLNGAAENLVLSHVTQNSPPPKMCVFYIGASAPGEPVLYAHGFHNASCGLDIVGPGPYNFTSK